MQVNPIGTPTPRSGGQFLRMKQANDKVQFRIAQEPVFEGKHFTQKEDETWSVTSCGRIDNGDDCDLCDKFFSIKAEEKLARESGDKDAAEALKKQARHYAATTIYYFSILNRDTSKAAILQTTMGVKNEMDKKALDGIKVFDRDWVLRNTGSASPKDRYSLTPVDSSETKKIEGDELAEFQKALDYNMMKINSGNTASDQIAEVKEPEEEIKIPEEEEKKKK